jgi:hypothetical protein
LLVHTFSGFRMAIRGTSTVSECRFLEYWSGELTRKYSRMLELNINIMVKCVNMSRMRLLYSHIFKYTVL